MRRTTEITAVCLGALALVIAGCQSLPKISPTGPDISAERKLRKAEIYASVERKKTAAQIRAARSRWALGDVAGCFEMLDLVLERDPDNGAARELIAKIESGVEPVSHQEFSSGDPAEPLFGAPPLFAGSGSDRHQGYASLAGDSHSQAAKSRRITTIDGQHNGDDDVRRSDESFAPALLPAADAMPLGDADFSGGNGKRLDNAYLENAAQALQKDDIDEARRQLLAVADGYDTDSDLAVSAVVLPLRYDRPALSLEVADAALQRFDGAASLHRAVAIAHYRRGDYESSQIALRQALSLDNGHPLTYFLLGHTLAKLGDADAAQWNFLQARRAGADGER